MSEVRPAATSPAAGGVRPAQRAATVALAAVMVALLGAVAALGVPAGGVTLSKLGRPRACW